MQNKGRYYEQVAERYLRHQGLKTVARNEHCGRREIDLIMRDRQYWVFVEVKYRQNEQYGGALMALGTSQMKRLRQAASYYLAHQRIDEAQAPCRFDVVCITGNGDQEQLQWIKNAF